MILDFGSYIINEASLKKLKREVHGVLNMSARKRMRKELRDNIITFKFQKRNGEIRTAHGTLHPDYLPKLKGGGPRPEHQMVYFDLDKDGWRSFRSFKFIKILNIKPVDGPPPKPAPKPISKPKHKTEDEEEVKKPIHSEKEEKEEVKKPVHKEKEEKVEKKPIHSEKEKEKEEPESILDDKETEEEKEVIKKDKEKEKEEKEEKEKEEKKEKVEKEKKEKDEDEDKDNDEKKKTNESVNPVEEYPNVTVLGDGEYDGALWGHCFVYEGQKYYSECGWKNIFPSYCKMVIENGKAWAHQVDIYQRESLKKLYQ